MNSLYEAMSAMEGFLDPETTASKLLAAVRENITNNVKTVEEAAALELRLSQEAAQFNDCLTTISNAIHKFERGEISREEMVSESTPCVTMLKTKSEALKLANINAPSDDITEEEIAILREYIVGCKDIIAAHKEKLQGCACASASANEGLLFSMSNMDPAMEAARMDKEIRNSTDAKTAKQLYMQARKLYGLGSKEKAKKYLAQAKKLYEKCLKQAKANAKMVKVDRTVKTGNNTVGSYSVKDVQKGKEVTENYGFASVIAYFEDRIDACTALQMQWDNKAGNKTFAETKKALALERAKTRRGNAAKAAAQKVVKKAMKAYKPETPEEQANEAALIDIVYACESMLNEMEMEDAIAMEAEGAEESAEDPKIARLRELAVELKKAQTSGDEAAAKKASAEMEKLMNAIEKEAQDAYTQEEYDKAKNKRLKVAAIVAGSIAAVGVGTAVGIKTGAFKKIVESIKSGVEKVRSKKGKEGADAAKGVANSSKSAFGTLKANLANLFKKKQGAEKPADSSTDASTEAWIDAMESYMDSLELDLALDAAMESEGEEDSEESSKSPSKIGAKLRAAFSKLKKAKSKEEAREAQEEVKEAAEELEDASDEAETPEKKEKLSTAAKIGIAAAATAAVTVGLTVLGQQLGKNAKVSGRDPKGLAKVLINASNAICKKAGEAKTYVAGQYANATSKIARAERALMREQRKQDAIRKMETQEMIKGREKIEAKKRKAEDREFRAYQKKKAKGTLGNESFLSSLAFGLESEIDDDDYFDPEEDAKAFDDDDMIDEAVESWYSDMGDVAVEAMLDVMMAEDGIVDPEY